MSQHFNLTRFGRLLRQHTTENLPAYLMSTAVLAGGILAVLGTLTYLMHRPLMRETQLVLFLFGLLSSGALFTSSVFAAISTPGRAALALLLPASHLEKYAVAWLYSLPVFLAVYTGAFLLVNVAVLQLSSHGQAYEVYDFSRGAREWLTPLLSYALLHSLWLWGAVYFKQRHLLRTAFVAFGLLAVLWAADYQIIKALLPAGRPTVPFGGVYIDEPGHSFLLELPESQWQLTMVLAPLALAALLWLAAYARLTEKQL